nr:hypothetical protein [uncultured bacterium]
MSEEAEPTAVVRRLGREYGWLLAAVGLAALVLVCSVPFVSGAGMSWTSGDPLAAPVDVAPPAGGATGAGPQPPPGAPTSPAPTVTASPSPTASKASSQRRPASRTTSPTARRTTAPPPAVAPQAPVAVGPEGGAMGLWGMLRDYCQDIYRTDEAQLRYGTSQAEDNWECRRRGEDPLIDMQAACRRKYGSAAVARFSNRDDAFSWRCYR